MSNRFQGFPKEALQFFSGLAKNNNRDWFEARKQVFVEAVKEPMEALTTEVCAAMGKFAPAYVMEPKKAIYRIYRDTRFSPNKTPYKDHIGALLRRGDLPKNESAGFYFAVNDKCVGVAGGSYAPGPDQLKLIRSHLLQHHQRFTKLTGNKALTAALGQLQGSRLSRPPKGFLPETPGIEFIKGKQWYYYVELDPKLALTAGVVKEIVSRLQKVTPIVEFLNEPLVVSRKRVEALDPGGWF